MLQRIQTLYLLASCVLCVVCLCFPLGYFTDLLGAKYAELFNLWVTTVEDGSRSFSPWALFVLLVGVSTLTFLDIMLFTRRALQMRVVAFCMVLLVGYYIYLGVFAWMYMGDGGFRPSVTAALPLVAIVLDYLAFRGILKDEMLVKSLDRLR